MSSYLVKGGLVLTGDLGVSARRADVLIDEDRIAAIAPDLSADCPVIDASDCIVMPGMVDTSRHTWQTLARGVCGDMTGPGYWRSIRGQAALCHTPDDLKLGNLAGMLEAIDAGITTVFDFSNNVPGAEHAEALIEGIVESGIRCRFAPAFNAVPGETAEFASPEGRRKLIRTLRRDRFSSDSGLVTLAAGLSDIPMVGFSQVREEIELCRSLGLRMTLNCEAFRPEGAPSELDQIDQAGLLGPDLLFVHMVTATREQLGRVRDTGGAISICPETTSALGRKVPSTVRVLEAGLHPTFGVDVVSAWSGDLFSQARLALQMAKVACEAAVMERGRPTALASWPTCREMFHATTAWGAEAVGLGHEIGTLEPGRQADIILVRTDAINTMPVNDPYSTVILQAHPGNVDTVFVAGIPRKRQGRLLHDLTALRQSIAAAHGRLIERVEALGGWLPDAPNASGIEASKVETK